MKGQFATDIQVVDGNIIIMHIEVKPYVFHIVFLQ